MYMDVLQKNLAAICGGLMHAVVFPAPLYTKKLLGF